MSTLNVCPTSVTRDEGTTLTEGIAASVRVTRKPEVEIDRKSRVA